MSLLSMQAFHFDRDDIALPGAHKYFKKQSDCKRDDAEKMMKYQNERAGRIVLQAIAVSFIVEELYQDFSGSIGLKFFL